MPPKFATSQTRRRSCRLLAAVYCLLPAAALEAQPSGPAPPTPPPSSAQSPAPASEFGAIAFTADGSFSSAWKRPSKAEVEAKVLAECAKLARGKCEVVSFREELCAAIASSQISKEHKITYAGGGLTRTDAQRSALDRCNGDRRARGSCRLRTVVCGDGR